MFEVNQQRYQDWQERLKTDQNFRKFWVFWSNYSSPLFIIGFIYLYYQKDWVLMAAFSVIAFAFARGILNPLLAKKYPTKRPYQEWNFKPIESKLLSWVTQHPNSFPSRHVMAMAAVAGVAFWFNIPTAIFFVLIAALTGAGRVVLGYHYPRDIAFALFFGTLSGLIIVAMLRLLLFTDG